MSGKLASKAVLGLAVVLHLEKGPMQRKMLVVFGSARQMQFTQVQNIWISKIICWKGQLLTSRRTIHLVQLKQKSAHADKLEGD